MENPDQQGSAELTFFDHLQELRTRIMWSVFWLVAGCLVAGVFNNWLMEVIVLGPARASGIELQVIRPFEKIWLYFKVVFAAGLLLSLPMILHQVWLFVAPGLYQHERRWARLITVFTTLCFVSGVLFAYYVMLPSMFGFAKDMGTKEIAVNIVATEYLGTIVTICLAAGLIFELPMISFVLTKAGILEASFLRTYRRHSVVVILVLAAIITPTPDPFNQLVMALPLYVLFEVSIIVSALAARSGTSKEGTTRS